MTRIDLMLTEISETMLCDLPERSPWSIKEFLQNMEVHNCHPSILPVNVNTSKLVNVDDIYYMQDHRANL